MQGRTDGAIDLAIPKHVQVETINGVCSASCTMCTKGSWTRKPNKMSTETFELIMKKFVQYQATIEYLTLHDCGEPLLDTELPSKVRIAKALGFRGTGFATNCTHLDKEMSLRLLEAGLDTIICSVDGIKKETHESIRVGTDFDEVVANVRRFIRLRDEAFGNTRVMVRFIRQQINKEEWPLFREAWGELLDPDKNDRVTVFDVHNWGNSLEGYKAKDSAEEVETGPLNCVDLSERMLIYSSGAVGLCCADDNGFYDLGNVITDDPIAIYNGEIFCRYRKMMNEGRILELEHCKNCTIPRSRALKEVG